MAMAVSVETAGAGAPTPLPAVPATSVPEIVPVTAVSFSTISAFPAIWLPDSVYTLDESVPCVPL